MTYRTPGVTAGVALVHAGLIWLVMAQLSTPAWTSPGEQVMFASVIADMPAPALQLPMPPTAAPSPAQSIRPIATSAPVRPEPAATAPSQVSSPTALASVTPQTAPVMPASAASGSTRPAPASVAAVVLPSSDADYLQNPKPAYPPVSKRLGEQGKVIVRVLIAADGTPQKAELRQSSGFERLDQVALATVLKWRYVPGKRGGVPEAMWFNVPINFVLE